MIPCLECPGVEERVPIRSVVGSVAFEEEVQVEIIIEGLRVFLDPPSRGNPDFAPFGATEKDIFTKTQLPMRKGYMLSLGAWNRGTRSPQKLESKHERTSLLLSAQCG